MDKWLQERAMMAAAASNTTSTRLNGVMDRVIRKLQSETEEVSPTEAELAMLRERYLEHRAVDDEQKRLWCMYRSPSGRFEMFAIFVKMLYRLTLFAAAVVILYRAIMGWISHWRSFSPIAPLLTQRETWPQLAVDLDAEQLAGCDLHRPPIRPTYRPAT
jgi:hypothetical protein